MPYKKVTGHICCSWQEMAHENQNDSDEIDASQSSFAVTATLILVPLKSFTISCWSGFKNVGKC